MFSSGSAGFKEVDFYSKYLFLALAFVTNVTSLDAKYNTTPYICQGNYELYGDIRTKQKDLKTDEAVVDFFQKGYTSPPEACAHTGY